MLLIGSVAAKIRGCLPDWRNGQTDDVDLVGTQQELMDLFHELDIREEVILRERPNGMAAIFRLGDPRPPKIEFDPRRRASHLMLEQLSDNTEHVLLGFTVWAVSERTQYMLKKAYEDIPILREKNDQDLAFWASRLDTTDIESDPLYCQLRQEMLNDFSELLQA